MWLGVDGGWGSQTPCGLSMYPQGVQSKTPSGEGGALSSLHRVWTKEVHRELGLRVLGLCPAPWLLVGQAGGEWMSALLLLSMNWDMT